MELADREDIERRLLALVRDWMDDEDAVHGEGGWDVADLIVLFEVHRAPAADYELQPWDRNGAWRKDPGWATTCNSYWAQESLLEGALRLWQDEKARRQWDLEDAEDEDEAEEEDEGNSRER